MNKIREVLRLHATTTMSVRQLSRALSVSRPVVSENLARFKATGLTWEDVKDLSDGELRDLLTPPAAEPVGRRAELEARFPAYVTELKKTGVTLKRLWQEYLADDRRGYSYPQFCSFFAAWRDRHQLSMHITHKAGEKVFVDFAGDRLCLVEESTGQPQRFDVFVAVLGGSGLTYAEPRRSQKTWDWIDSLQHALQYFGGVPQIVVPDNAKAVISGPDAYEPYVTPLFAAFPDHYELLAEPARPRHPKDKALAENAVRLVYQRIYAPLRTYRYRTDEELGQRFREYLEEHNRAPLQKLARSRRELFESVERETLRPLPAQAFTAHATKVLKVQINYHVELREDRHYYSVPWQYRGLRVTVLYDERTVSVYHDRARIAHHCRKYVPGGYTTDRNHLPPAHRAYDSWDSPRLLSWARSIGERTAELVGQLLAARPHPEQAFKSCLGVLSLAKRFGGVRLEAACGRALSLKALSYRRIKNMLENGTETEHQAEFALEPENLPDHENIRGGDYYK